MEFFFLLNDNQFEFTPIWPGNSLTPKITFIIRRNSRRLKELFYVMQWFCGLAIAFKSACIWRMNGWKVLPDAENYRKFRAFSDIQSSFNQVVQSSLRPHSIRSDPHFPRWPHHLLTLLDFEWNTLPLRPFNRWLFGVEEKQSERKVAWGPRRKWRKMSHQLN